jgi:hypothetical protein
MICPLVKDGNSRGLERWVGLGNDTHFTVGSASVTREVYDNVWVVAYKVQWFAGVHTSPTKLGSLR